MWRPLIPPVESAYRCHYRTDVERASERGFGTVNVAVQNQRRHLRAVLTCRHLVRGFKAFRIVNDESVLQPKVVLDRKTIE